MRPQKLMKDAVMDELVQRGVNVASFVSFGPDGAQRFCRIHGVPPEKQFADPTSAVRALYESGMVENINVRTFLPEKPDGNPFFLGEKEGFADPSIAAACIAKHIDEGYYVIINENIDPSDGGFSGVALGDTVEFAACDTPRCVEKQEGMPCAILSRDVTRRLVKDVYDFNFIFPYDSMHRIEFSVHPGPVGYYRQKMIIWQVEEIADSEWKTSPTPAWPNRYSFQMGDKAFGLLMAHLHDFPVPRTKVIGRIIPPFEFGEELKNGEGSYIRTCPRTQEPGQFTTRRGHLDLFAIMQEEDPTGERIASVLSQDAVRATYSGATITGGDGSAIIEGRKGRGDPFMLGDKPPDELPREVLLAIKALWHELSRTFGTVRFEWVYDGFRRQPWIVQLHGGKSASVGDIIVEGNALVWHDFSVPGDLDELRTLSAKAKKKGAGIRLVGNIGLTSHPCDILRREGVPSRLCRSA